MSKIVTRFAPSPTGWLHVGGLRTALFNYLVAKKNKGEFILRIEDTDQARLVEGADQQLQDTLANFGLIPDKFFRQSERLKMYQAVAKQLVDKGLAYEQTGTEGKHEGLTAIYFKVPEQDIVVKDELRGEVKIEKGQTEDFVILKSDGYPTYHLASVVDDNDMNVTHVIRGEEWLPSLPKHVLLYQALGFDLPKFVHLPLLLNPDKTKLSKRQGDVAVEDFLAKGYLREALLNYVAFLGWNPGTDEEVFSLEELTNAFSLEKLNHSGAIFDTTKLNWLNAHYIRTAFEKKDENYKLILERLKTEFMPDHEEGTIEKVFSIFATRLDYLSLLPEQSKFIFKLEPFDPQLLVFKKSDLAKTKQGLHLAVDSWSNVNPDNWTQENLEGLLKEAVESAKLGFGDVFWPVRVALSGQEASPSPIEIAWVLGPEETLQRIKNALKKLESMV